MKQNRLNHNTESPSTSSDEQWAFERTTTTFPAAYTWSAANWALDFVEKNPKDMSQSAALCVIMMSMFTLEAFLNSVGQEKVADWKQSADEKSIKIKIEVLSKRFGFPVDWKEKPFSSWKALRDYRCSVAHGRSTTKKDSGTTAASRRHHVEPMSPTWVKQTTSGRAMELFRDVRCILETIGDKADCHHMYMTPWVAIGKQSPMS